MFAPVSVLVTSDGKCLYQHEFNPIANNPHLLSGMIYALQSLYRETFDSDLNHLELNSYRFLFRRLPELSVALIYKGPRNDGELFLTELLSLFSEHRVLDDIIRFLRTSAIDVENADRIDNLLVNRFEHNFSKISV